MCVVGSSSKSCSYLNLIIALLNYRGLGTTDALPQFRVRRKWKIIDAHIPTRHMLSTTHAHAQPNRTLSASQGCTRRSDATLPASTTEKHMASLHLSPPCTMPAPPARRAPNSQASTGSDSALVCGLNLAHEVGSSRVFPKFTAYRWSRSWPP